MLPRLEITDLVRSWRADGTRTPVVVADVAARLRASGQARAARVVEQMPAHDGVLDDAATDALVIRVHCELQRLSEELVQGRRVLELLDPLVDRLRRDGEGPVRVLDVGCGLGYLPRWLAAHACWGGDVEVVGVDRDVTLVAEATRLAAVEGLAARFVAGDAWRPGTAIDDPARTVVLSMGLLHHLPADELPVFFSAQAGLGVAAFAHWDPAPGRLAVLGGWVFHRARMREAVSRHDGVLSVRRAHPAAVLEAAARAGAPSYDVGLVGGRPPTGVLHAVTGVRR